MRRLDVSDRKGGLVQLGPTMLFAALFLFVPLLTLATYSLSEKTGFAVFELTFTLDNYRSAIGTDLYLGVIAQTMVTGLIVAGVVVGIAYPLAYILTFVFPSKRELVYLLILVSLFGGYVVRIYAWRTILDSSGIINGSLVALGAIDEPIAQIGNSRFAVVIALVNFLLPLALLPLYASFQNLPRELIDASRDLGAPRRVVIRTVILPLTKGGFRAAIAFSFVLAAGDYATSALLGGTSGIMVGRVIADQFTVALNWPLGAALAVVAAVIVAGLYAIVMLVFSRLAR